MIKNLNYILVLATIFILAAIGIIFIYGSGYSWVQSVNMPEWRQTPVYQRYLDNLNLAVVPLAVGLVVVLGLCIPKRLFSGVMLLQAMGALLALTLAAVILLGSKLGLGFLLIVAVLIQIMVIALTITGSRRLSYEVQGFYVQIGSALLHLGLILFLLDFILLTESPPHLMVFWFSTAFIGIGMVMAFYSQELSGLIRR